MRTTTLDECRRHISRGVRRSAIHPGTRCGPRGGPGEGAAPPRPPPRSVVAAYYSAMARSRPPPRGLARGFSPRRLPAACAALALAVFGLVGGARAFDDEYCKLSKGDGYCDDEAGCNTKAYVREHPRGTAGGTARRRGAHTQALHTTPRDGHNAGDRTGTAATAALNRTPIRITRP